MTAISINRILKPWFWSSSIFRITTQYKPFIKAKTAVMGFVRDLVMIKLQVSEKKDIKKNTNKPDATETSVDTGKISGKVFLDQAIQIHLKKEFSFDDIIFESSLLVFASYDTSAAALFSTLMLLAMHPQYQKRVYEEIVSVFPDEDFDVNYEDFKNLVYLDMCINETLRLATVIPLIARTPANDLYISNDLVIPEGTQIIMDIFNLHRDKDIWGPNAGFFDPDRFLPENVAARHKYSYLPFSKGQRNCIGWQYALISMKISLLKILRRYRLSTKFRYEDLRFIANVTLTYEKYPLFEIHRR